MSKNFSIVQEIKKIINNTLISNEKKIQSIKLFLNKHNKIEIPAQFLELIEKICFSNDINIEAFFSKCRKREIVICRQIFAYEVYTTYSLHCKYSFSLIAKYINTNWSNLIALKKRSFELFEIEDSKFIEYYTNYKNYKNE